VALRGNGDIEIVKLLLRHGANPRCKKCEQLLPLVKQHSDRELAQLLLEKGADTPPAFPILDEDVVRLILECGYQPIRFPINLSWLLEQAATHGFERVARLCIDFGADPNRRLWQAAASGSEAIVRVLLHVPCVIACGC
jgi:ankyrin repeat protein